MRLVIDADSILYSAASVCEERSIKATHLKTNKSRVFKNRTALFGTANNPGYLTEINKDREVPFVKEDFLIEDIVTAVKTDVECFAILKNMLNGLLKRVRFDELADTYVCFVGSGETFRHKKATLLEYKGNRKNVPKPLYLKACRDYLLKNFPSELITDIEADDAVQIEGVKGYVQWQQSGDEDDRTIVVSIDKDAKRGPGWLFNPDKDTKPRLIEGFGKLEVVQKGKSKDVDGYGRVYGYWQVLYGDPTDNYFANCFSDTRWGKISAYEALADCKNDAEALKVLIECYKKLYPEPKVITGWTGETFEIDWKYVLREIYAMATMKVGNHEPDIEWLLRKYEVPFE